MAIEASHDQSNLFGFNLRTDGERGSFLNLYNKNLNGKITDQIRFRKGEFSNISMNGQEVYKFAIREVPIIISDLLKKIDFDSADVDWLILHQANQRILDAVGERLKINKDKILTNLNNYGLSLIHI